MPLPRRRAVTGGCAPHWPWCCRPMLGFQALLEVNLRLAATGYLSNGYNSLHTGMTLPILLSSTVTSLSVRVVTYSTTYCFFRYTRV